MRIFLGILLFVVIDHHSTAQSMEGGIGPGFSMVRGDLNPNLSPITARPGGDIFLRYNFNEVISAKFEMAIGMIAADDNLSRNALNKTRGWQMKGIMQDWHTNLEYNFLSFRSYKTTQRANWTPLLSLGFGQIRVPKRELITGDRVSLNNQKGPANNLSYGFGFKKMMNDRVNLSGNFNAYLILDKFGKDLLDGAGYNELGEPKVNYAISATLPEKLDFVNTKDGDKYYFASVTVSYLLFGSNCPGPKTKKSRPKKNALKIK